MKKKTSQLTETERFLNVVHQLRTKCPWDKKQTHESLTRYLLEESYEAVEAIHSKKTDSIKEELGDVLLQVALHSEIASEKRQFTFEEVSKAVADKMIRRHPHVFTKKKVRDFKSHMKNWTQLKLAEKPKRKMLEGIPKSMPALQLAQRYGEIAGSMGFDWQGPEAVWEKVEGEVKEFKRAMKNKSTKNRESEFGALLFSLVQLARHLQLDAEQALKSTDEKFRKRFTQLEKRRSKTGRKLFEISAKDLEEEWKRLK